MKSNLTITKVLIGIIALTLSSCSSWRYQHSRVSVDREKTTNVATAPNSTVEVETASNDKVIEGGKMEVNSINYNHSTKSDKVNSNNNNTIKLPLGAKTKSPINDIVDHFKKHSNAAHQVKNVEKSTASGWVRIMIILLVVGFIVLLIGIFLSVFVSGAFWWLFYALGGLLLLAGLIVLILGLLGLI